MDVDITNENIRNIPIKITAVKEWGEVQMDIGGVNAAIVEPKPWLLEAGLVYLCGDGDDFWEKHLNARGYTGCTDDPRILNIAQNVKMCWVSPDRVGEVIPPLKENPSAK